MAGERAFNVLAGCLRGADRDDARRQAAARHDDGAAHLGASRTALRRSSRRGDEARRPIPMTPEDLLDAAVLIYLDGLGVRRKAG